MHSGVNDTYLKLKRKLSKTNKLKKKSQKYGNADHQGQMHNEIHSDPYLKNCCIQLFNFLYWLHLFVSRRRIAISPYTSAAI